MSRGLITRSRGGNRAPNLLSEGELSYGYAVAQRHETEERWPGCTALICVVTTAEKLAGKSVLYVPTCNIPQ